MAELQAAKFLELSGVTEPPVPEKAITGLPRVQVERVKLTPTSAATEWSHGRWLILLNAAEAANRQRFSLAHELKHIVDNPFIHLLYPAVRGASHSDRAEQICDYFAGCLLMPRPWLKRQWGRGVQDPRVLARRFEVSQAAMNVRLRQIGLSEPVPRCGVAV
ncbi:MAG: ImmA/IrrE family metallo-endopeptidase [Actinomycetota bacterium]|nr:ImmA/IrrE family metallo-endopeptidase [Actinomycetota bacterium]